MLKPILCPNLSKFKVLVEETGKITNKFATTPETLSDFIKDNMFLERAIAAGATYLVSGDADLLVLENFNDIPIITVKHFFDAHPECDFAEM